MPPYRTILSNEEPHIGSPPDSRMNTAAKKRGIPLQGTARQFTREDFENFDLILAMDKANYQDILSLDRTGKYQEKVKLMCDYARYHPEKEVPDPYYGGREGFERVIELLLDSCGSLLEEVKTKFKFFLSANRLIYVRGKNEPIPRDC